MLDSKKIKNEFPILQTLLNNKPLVYLDNAATTQKPKVVLDKIINFYSTSNSNIHRGVHQLSLQASREYEDAREKVCSFINVEKLTEIIFTHGTTDSINLLAHSFGEMFIDEGDEIIISQMEHHSNLIPWQIVAQKKKATLKIIPINNNNELDIHSLSNLITKRTKIISLTYVSNVLGTVNSIKEVIEIAHKQNIPVAIDGAQAIQHIPIDVQELDCDFFMFSGHKIYAETGIGVLYGKEKWLKMLPPYQHGGGMVDEVSFEKTVVTSLPLKFEAGTTNYVGAISLAEAIDYIQKIGLKDIQEHENNLLKYAFEALSKIKKIKIYGNENNSCGAISFNLDNIHPYDVGTLLNLQGIAVRTGSHCAQPLMKHLKIDGCIRASFALYNTTSDIDVLIEGIKKAQTMLTQ